MISPGSPVDSTCIFLSSLAFRASGVTLLSSLCNSPETNSENRATLTEALIKDTDLDLSEIPSSGSPESSLESVEHCSNVDSDARKSRKRRRAVAICNYRVSIMAIKKIWSL